MAVNEAIMIHGDPVYADYTPGGDIPAGEVIPLFGAAGLGGVAIPHLPLYSGVKGAVAVGNGVYEVAGDAVIANGTLVYWDDTANRATATATGNRQLGYAVSACTGAGAKFWVHHVKA